jgi:Flp pilus assembly protein TadB
MSNAELIGVGGLTVGAGAVAYLWRRVRLGRIAVARLDALLPRAESEVRIEPATVEPVLRRHRMLPWLVAAAVGAALYFATSWGWLIASTAGVIVGLLGSQLEGFLAGRRTMLIEVQLADAIDLMTGSLQAGGGVTNAFENAIRETRWPLRPQLEEVLGRIRYGDDPQAVLRSLASRVPLETFRLFTSVLSVHWEVGGSLAPTLATVGRQIRDRIELSRRLRSLTVQSRASTIAVLATTYFIALVMWNSDPDRVSRFLETSLGKAFVAGSAVLQAIGIVVASAMSRLKF